MTAGENFIECYIRYTKSNKIIQYSKKRGERKKNSKTHPQHIKLYLLFSFFLIKKTHLKTTIKNTIHCKNLKKNIDIY